MSTPPVINTNGITPLPMFAASGWTTASAQKADGLLSHFFESDYYQSNLYAGNISNLQYLIQQYGLNIVDLINNVRTTLENYLGRFYQQAVVTVTSNGNDPTYDGSQLTLTISATVTEQGQQLSFGYLVSAANSIISNIARINNTGAAF
jgi:hypothetical protein